MTMEGTTEPLEMLTVSDENVAVEEELARKNGGWVISFTLTSQCGSPVAVRISVPMPDEPARQDVGFHPRHEPESWGLRDGILSFEDTVPADEPLQILLGIVLVGDEDVTLSLSEPSIELSQAMDSAEDGEDAEKAPIFRSSSMRDVGQSSVDSDASTESATTDSSIQSDSGESTSAAESGSQSGGDIFQSPDAEPAEASDETSPVSGINMDKLNEISNEIRTEQEAEDFQTGQEPELDEEDSDDGPSDGFLAPYAKNPQDVEVSEDSEPAEKEASPVSDTEDILSTLVERLESADPDDDDIETIRKHLVPESQKATAVRLQHVQSRMDDLAAYTEALEDLINEHGTASDFMSKVEENIDDVRSQVTSIQNEFDSAETERNELRERVDGVESSIEELDDDLRGRTENISEELESMREKMDSRDGKVRNLRESVHDHDDELESLSGRVRSTEDQLEDHRDALDQRLSTLSNQMSEIQRTLESDYGELQEEVESLSEMREVFAQAFAGQDIADEMNEGQGNDGSANDVDDSE